MRDRILPPEPYPHRADLLRELAIARDRGLDLLVPVLHHWDRGFESQARAPRPWDRTDSDLQTAAVRFSHVGEALWPDIPRRLLQDVRMAQEKAEQGTAFDHRFDELTWRSVSTLEESGSRGGGPGLGIREAEADLASRQVSSQSFGRGALLGVFGLGLLVGGALVWSFSGAAGEKRLARRWQEVAGARQTAIEQLDRLIPDEPITTE